MIYIQSGGREHAIGEHPSMKYAIGDYANREHATGEHLSMKYAIGENTQLGNKQVGNLKIGVGNMKIREHTSRGGTWKKVGNILG
jgi:hypothetical protein